LAEVIPVDYINYFAKFLDSLTERFKGYLYRYITPSESVYWVAYDGFHLGRSYVKKVSMTLSPMLYTWSLASWKQRYEWIGLMGDFYTWAKAVPYTYELDPNTRDPLYVYEFEMAVYAEDYKQKLREEHPWMSEEGILNSLILPIKDVSMVRLIHEALEEGINEKDYFKLKVLPGYVHGSVYHRSPYKMLPRRMLAQQLAVVAVTKKDFKVRYASNYTWDNYWEEKRVLSYPPNYEKALKAYQRQVFTYTYDADDIESVCIFSYVPLGVCWELMDEIVDEIEGIYSFFDVTVKFTGLRKGAKAEEVTPTTSQGLALYSSFPQLFRTPYEAEHFLKWWHGTYEDALRYLEEFIRNERLYRSIWLGFDPEVREG
jgi:hypothetical protein